MGHVGAWGSALSPHPLLVRCTSCFASNATSIRFALRFQVTVLAWLFPVRLLIYIINFVDKIKFTLFVHFLLTCLLACLEVASYRYSFGSSRVGEERLRDEPKWMSALILYPDLPRSACEHLHWDLGTRLCLRRRSVWKLSGHKFIRMVSLFVCS